MNLTHPCNICSVLMTLCKLDLKVLKLFCMFLMSIFVKVKCTDINVLVTILFPTNNFNYLSFNVETLKCKLQNFSPSLWIACLYLLFWPGIVYFFYKKLLFSFSWLHNCQFSETKKKKTTFRLGIDTKEEKEVAAILTTT